MTNTPQAKGRDNRDQDQFLTILSREDAMARFEAALFPRPLPSEPRALADALGCALIEDVVAPIDVPPFDRSNVDGFAVRSADLASAAEAAPVRLMLNDEVIACGTAPTTAGAVGIGDIDRDRRAGAARGGRDRDGRTHPARGQQRDRNPPRRLARAVRLLRRLRHCARRGAAASWHHHRFARDRHAGGLRDRASHGGATDARRRPLHRRRTGAAGRGAAPRRDLRHQRCDRHRRDYRERRRRDVSRRHCRR